MLLLIEFLFLMMSVSQGRGVMFSLTLLISRVCFKDHICGIHSYFPLFYHVKFIYNILFYHVRGLKYTMYTNEI